MATKKTNKANVSSKKSPSKKTSTTKKRSTKKKTEKKINRRLSYSSLIIIIIAVFIFFYLGRKDEPDIIEEVNKQDQSIDMTKLDGNELSFYYPTADLSNGGIVEHLAYSLDYNEDHEQADWVFYELTRDEVEKKIAKRKDNFKPDPSATISSALPTDYRKSGYDRGHLCPAADNRWSEEAMDQSFYMSNMSPQHPDLNRKIWAELEEQVRQWAVENEKVYVATGPLLNDGFKYKIGESGVSVPNYFYKVVADLTGDEIKGIGFIFSNGENNGELKNYAFPIDMIEERTKIDFFYKLDEEIQTQIESEVVIEDWF